MNREAKPIVIAEAEHNEAAVTVIKMEVSGEIFWCWHTVKTAIPLPLLVRKKLDWHRDPSQFSGQVGLLGGGWPCRGSCKSCKFCEKTQECRFSAEFRLQKYAAKGSLNARIFARERSAIADEDRLCASLDTGSELASSTERLGKGWVPEDLPGKFQRMLDQIRPGDTIVVWELDRLARSTRDLLNTMGTIDEAGGRFQSLSEPWANTTTHAGKMIMTVFAGIAEFERDLIRERTSAGRAAATQRGVRFGRPPKLNPDQVQVASQLLSEGKPVRDITRTFNVHEATIYRLAAS